MVDDKIFKFKYRQFADIPDVFERRNARLVNRFTERARTRDPAIEADLFDIYQRDQKDNSVAQILLDEQKWNPTAVRETATFREYMVKEGLQ